MRTSSTFVRSGWINTLGVNFNGTGNTYIDAGAGGVWWSSRGSSTNAEGSSILSAYDLWVQAAAILPSFGPVARHHAFPLRCLSTVLDM